MVVQGDSGHAGSVGGVGLAAAAGGQQPRPGGEGRGDIDDVRGGGGQLLGDTAAESLGALDSEAVLRPALGPDGELGEGGGVDDETPGRQFMPGVVDGDGQR
ncbi:hypothetical protein FB564_1833 [Salinispora arenicola]|uniref:Uncharacterized protein n=1 Tax=Salinispora arenicola TaxID=168697 RepID=A0A542XLJ2_SALAC|nr:hypothetical protein FB564_1833 [Salinispora arenicola]